MMQTYLHLPGLEIEADFSEEIPPVYRYRLSATKSGADNNPKSVCAIMQNPSYATAEYADKSVQVLERVVFDKQYPEFEGVERLIIVNQFAFIQTIGFSGIPDQIGVKNDVTIQNAINESQIILIAWGKGNKFTERKKVIATMIKEQKEKILLQTSRHPSRVIYDDFIGRAQIDLTSCNGFGCDV